MPRLATASRQPSLPPLAIAVAGLLVLPGTALARVHHAEVGRAANADQIGSLYKIVLYIAAVVFVVVEGALVYSVYKFRAKKNPRRGADPRQHPARDRLDGRRRADPGGADGRDVRQAAGDHQPAELVRRHGPVGLASPSRRPPNGKKLTICVQGRQYIWRYTYGNGCLEDAFAAKLPYSYQEMDVPAGVTVVLAIQSTDVIHSWWVPSLGGKVDAVPGYTTYTWFKAPKAARGHSTTANAPSCAGASTRS